MPTLQVEYSKSARSACSACKEKLLKHELRIGTMITIGDVESFKWRHLCCFTDRQLKNAQASGDIDNINGYDGLAPADKALVDEMKKGNLIGKMEIKGRVGDIMNSSEAESLGAKTKTPAKRGKAGSEGSEGTPSKAAPKRSRAKKAVPAVEEEVQSDSTEEYEVALENCSDKTSCPYGTSCFRTDPSHFAQYSHGEEDKEGKEVLRPVIKRKLK